MENGQTVYCRIQQADGTEEANVCELVIIDGQPHAQLGTDRWALNAAQMTPAEGFHGIDYTCHATLLPRRLIQ